MKPNRQYFPPSKLKTVNIFCRQNFVLYGILKRLCDAYVQEKPYKFSAHKHIAAVKAALVIIYVRDYFR